MSQIKNGGIIFLVVLCFFQSLLGKEGVSYKYQRNACEKFNTKFIYNVSCHVRHLNRTTQVMNTEINFQPNVSVTNIRLDFTTYMRFGTVYRPSVIKHSEFICESLNNGVYSHFLNAFASSYRKYSNLLDPCPKSGKLYVKDMILDTSKFPQFLPIGEYRADITAFTYMNGKEEFISLLQDFVEVKPLGALQF